MCSLLQQILMWHFGDDLDPDFQLPDATIGLAADLVSNLNMHIGHLLNSGVAASIVSVGLLSGTQEARWQGQAKCLERPP